MAHLVRGNNPDRIKIAVGNKITIVPRREFLRQILVGGSLPELSQKKIISLGVAVTRLEIIGNLKNGWNEPKKDQNI